MTSYTNKKGVPVVLEGVSKIEDESVNWWIHLRILCGIIILIGSIILWWILPDICCLCFILMLIILMWTSIYKHMKQDGR